MFENAYLLLMLVAAVAELFISLLIVFGKVKQIRVLGIGFAFMSLGNVLTTVQRLLLKYGNLSSDSISRIVVASRYLQILFELAYLIFICIFLHKTYGKKFVYLPVLITSFTVRLLGNAASPMAVRLLNSHTISTETYQALSLAVNFLLGSIVSVIIIVFLFNNRKQERIIPRFWFFSLLQVIINLSLFLVLTLYYLTKQEFLAQVVSLLYFLTVPSISLIYVLIAKNIYGRRADTQTSAASTSFR